MKAERLSESERARMREALLMHIRGLRPTYKEFRFVRWFVSAPRRFAYVAVAMLIFVGGGLSYAAEGALPGNPLYSLKVNVNEPVRGALAFSPEAKVDVEAQIVERRLAEVSSLSSSVQELKPQLKEALLESAASHAETFANRLSQYENKVNQEHAVNVSSKVESSISSRVESKTLQRATESVAANVQAEPKLMMAVSSAPALEVSSDMTLAQEASSTLPTGEKAGGDSEDTEKTDNRWNAKNPDTSSSSDERLSRSAQRISEIRQRMEEKLKEKNFDSKNFWDGDSRKRD